MKYIKILRLTFSVLGFLFICVLFVESACEEKGDYYKILGISRMDSLNRVLLGYKEQLKEHPNERERINRAFEVIYDKEKGRIYEEQGEEGVREFEECGRHKDERKELRDRIMEFPLSMEDFYLGSIKHISVERNKLCPECRGSGGMGTQRVVCQKCQGKGRVLQPINFGDGLFVQMHAACTSCAGSGRVSYIIIIYIYIYIILIIYRPTTNFVPFVREANLSLR